MSMFKSMRAIAEKHVQKVNREERVGLKSPLIPFGVYDVQVSDYKEYTNIEERDGKEFIKDKDGSLIPATKENSKASIIFDFNLTNEVTKEEMYATYEISVINTPKNCVAGIATQLGYDEAVETNVDALDLMESIITDELTFKVCNSMDVKDFKKGKETVYYRNISFNAKKIESAREQIAEMND